MNSERALLGLWDFLQTPPYGDLPWMIDLVIAAIIVFFLYIGYNFLELSASEAHNEYAQHIDIHRGAFCIAMSILAVILYTSYLLLGLYTLCAWIYFSNSSKKLEDLKEKQEIEEAAGQ